MASLSLKDIERGVGADLIRRPIITSVLSAFMLRVYFDNFLELPQPDLTLSDKEDIARKEKFLSLDAPLPGSYDAVEAKRRATNHAFLEHVLASAIFVATMSLRAVGLAESVMWLGLATVFKLFNLPRIYAFEKLILDVRALLLPASVRHIDRNVRLISHPNSPLPKLNAIRRGFPYMPLTIITSAETLTRDTEDLLRLLRYTNRMTVAYWADDAVVLVGRNEALVSALTNLNKKPVFVDLGWHKDVLENTVQRISVTFLRDEFPPHAPHPHGLDHVQPYPRAPSEPASSLDVAAAAAATSAASLFPTSTSNATAATTPVPTPIPAGTAPLPNAAVAATDATSRTMMMAPNDDEDSVLRAMPSGSSAGGNIILSMDTPPSSTHQLAPAHQHNLSSPMPPSVPQHRRQSTSGGSQHFVMPTLRRASSRRYRQLRSPVSAVSKRAVKVVLEMEASTRNLELLLISLDQFGSICEALEPGRRTFNGKRFAIFTVGIFLALILVLYYQDYEFRRPEIDLLTLAFGVYTVWMTVGQSAAFGPVEEETPYNVITRQNILMAFHGLVRLPKTVVNVCWIPAVYRRDRHDGISEGVDDELDEEYQGRGKDAHSGRDGEGEAESPVEAEGREVSIVKSESRLTKQDELRSNLERAAADAEIIDGSISLMEAAIFLNIYYHYGHLIKWKGPGLLLDRYDFVEEDGDPDGIGHIVAVDRVARLDQLKYIGESHTLYRLGGSGVIRSRRRSRRPRTFNM